MTLLRGILTDLREKRLWPVAAALVVALVAVPVLLTKKTAPVPVAQAAAPQSAPVAPGVAIPAVNVQTTPVYSRLPGRGRDPFTQRKGGGAAASTSANTATTVTSPGTAPTKTKSSGGSSTAGSTTSTTPSTTTTTPTTTTTTPTATIPTTTPKPAPTGLTDTQTYHVTFAITNSAGGLNTIDPLERSSILPSKQQPRLVELGVLKGGDRVLFAVMPGTVVGGPGRCTPGPIDCEILSLSQDQIEALSMQSPTGVVPVALFAVTGIKAYQHSSVAAADAARRVESAAGRNLLSTSTLGALSLFKYEPSVGAVVDLRNLGVGGS